MSSKPVPRRAFVVGADGSPNSDLAVIAVTDGNPKTVAAAGHPPVLLRVADDEPRGRRPDKTLRSGADGVRKRAVAHAAAGTPTHDDRDRIDTSAQRLVPGCLPQSAPT